MIFKAFEIVVVPFPFTDSSKIKKRPALILSQNLEFNREIEHSVMAMITSKKNSPWPLDVPIKHLKQTGLTAPSVIRMKIFTLDQRFIIRKAGSLAKTDQISVKQSLSKLFEYL